MLITTCAISASVAMPPSIGRSGAGACTTAPSQARQPPAFAGAGSAWPAHHLHAQLGGNQIEHLATIIADHVQHTATARAFLIFNIDHDLVARQVRGQRTTIAVGYFDALPSLWRFCRVLGGIAFRGTLLRILQHQLQLLEVELL